MKTFTEYNNELTRLKLRRMAADDIPELGSVYRDAQVLYVEITNELPPAKPFETRQALRLHVSCVGLAHEVGEFLYDCYTTLSSLKMEHVVKVDVERKHYGSVPKSERKHLE